MAEGCFFGGGGLIRMFFGLCGFVFRQFCRKILQNKIFILYLQSRNAGFRNDNAEIAQLVERNLAKVEVAGPSPVFRSDNQ